MQVEPSYPVTVRVPASLRERLRLLVQPREQNSYFVDALARKVRQDEEKLEMVRSIGRMGSEK